MTSGKIQGGVRGPYNILLHSPALGESVLRLGEYIRFRSPLPVKINELAALLTTRAWGAQFPWYVHHRAAVDAGWSEDAVRALRDHRAPQGMSAEEQAAFDFCSELLNTTQLSDRTFNTAKARLGERDLVELMGVMGYYGIVSMMVNVDRYPLPEGIQPELN